ncbi:MAG: BatA domain-containing protein, partial [Anaerolineales bacterium]|nr:BatA domain-containing protein [Anaerolineales bacterium]
MNFAKPEYLLLLVTIPAVGMLMYYASKKRKQSLSKLGESQLLRRLTSSINWRGRRWKNALLLMS